MPDYGIYTPKQLYVKKKYSNYKQESLQHLSIHQYNTCSIKADAYMGTDQVRYIFAHLIYPEVLISRGIKIMAPISVNHIMSIILYCDLDTYSAKFSATFRKLESYETLQSVKQRNAEFWWQSKSFKEAVEVFGRSDTLIEDEIGPFFTGINCVLPIPQFLINLYGPTSTSVDIEVATNFADEDGMIIQFEVCFISLFI